MFLISPLRYFFCNFLPVNLFPLTVKEKQEGNKGRGDQTKPGRFIKRGKLLHIAPGRCGLWAEAGKKSVNLHGPPFVFNPSLPLD